MKVLVLGATGYIGSAIVDHLLAAGHTPVAVTRGADAKLPAGAQARQADLTKPETLSGLVTDDIDAVVHAAAPTGDWAADLAALRALLASLRGTGRAFVYTSGVWVLGGGTADEQSPLRPIAIVDGRDEVERTVLDAAAEDVRGVVIRPGIVHGAGGGIPGMMIGWAAEHGAGRYVGAAGTRWPMVHRDDLAELFVAAVDKARPGTILHGVTEPAVPVEDLARAADLAAGGAGQAESWPQADAAETLGAAFAEALALDQRVTAPASAALGWRPTGPDAVSDLRGAPAEPVSELRLAITVEDYDTAVRFYRDALGLSVQEHWDEPHGRGTILAAGRATIELIDPAQAAHIDEVEVGERVAPPIRVALQVADSAATASALGNAGGTVLAQPRTTPWNHHNARLTDPAGVQLTLFTDLNP